MRRNPVVDKFLARVRHPQQGTIDRIRDTILGVDDRIVEALEPEGPAFVYRGVIATIVLRSNSYAQLLLPTGALLRDPDGLLEGTRRDARCIRFQSVRAVEENRGPLEGLIRDWIALRSVGVPRHLSPRRLPDQQ